MSLHQARGGSAVALDASCFCGAAFEPSNRIISQDALRWVGFATFPLRALMLQPDKLF